MMKATLILPLACCAAALLVAANPKGEVLPAGAGEKIAAALPDKAYAKPEEADGVGFFQDCGFPSRIDRHR